MRVIVRKIMLFLGIKIYKVTVYKGNHKTVIYCDGYKITDISNWEVTNANKYVSVKEVDMITAKPRFI